MDDVEISDIHGRGTLSHFIVLSFFTLFNLRVSTFFIKDHDDDDDG